MKKKGLLAIFLLIIVALFSCKEKDEDLNKYMDDGRKALNKSLSALGKQDTDTALEEIDNAISEFNDAVDEDDEDFQARLYRGQAYLIKLQLLVGTGVTDCEKIKNARDNAQKDLDKAIDLEENSTPAYYYRGQLYLFSGDYKRAIDDLTKAIKLNKYFTLAYNERASAYTQSGDTEKAAKDITKVTELAKADTDAGKHIPPGTVSEPIIATCTPPKPTGTTGSGSTTMPVILPINGTPQPGDTLACETGITASCIPDKTPSGLTPVCTIYGDKKQCIVVIPPAP